MLAPTDRISETKEGSTDCKPASISIATGKKAITTMSRIFGARSKPNQRMKIGASATLGTFWNSTISGYSARPKRSKRTIMTAKTIPTTADSTNPKKISRAVACAAIASARQLAMREATMAVGAGNTKADTWKTRMAASQSITITTDKPSAGMMSLRPCRKWEDAGGAAEESIIASVIFVPAYDFRSGDCAVGLRRL